MKHALLHALIDELMMHFASVFNFFEVNVIHVDGHRPSLSPMYTHIKIRKFWVNFYMIICIFHETCIIACIN